MKTALTSLIFVFFPLAWAVPDGFVSVGQSVPGILSDIRYHGENNFVGAPIDGYLTPRCILSTPAAKALAKANEIANKKGFGLKVFDCYRPQKAVDHFVRWANDLMDTQTKQNYYPRVSKKELFTKGYIAFKSGHSRGSTVDLTLIQNGEELDMGSPFDFFDVRSHTASQEVSEQAKRNRLLLKSILERAGFSNYPKEWWHYTLKDEPFPERYFDFNVE